MQANMNKSKVVTYAVGMVFIVCALGIFMIFARPFFEYGSRIPLVGTFLSEVRTALSFASNGFFGDVVAGVAAMSIVLVGWVAGYNLFAFAGRVIGRCFERLI